MTCSEKNISHQQRIWQVINQIPAGKVASYGQVAKQAGLGNAARLVGSTLRQLPDESKLPWHRVINAQGKISFPEQSPKFLQQKQLLLAEGILFTNNKIPRCYFLWV